MKKIYLIGSLRNLQVPLIGKAIRAEGYEVFDDWFSGGYEADDKWQAYEQTRGRHYGEALYGEAARNIFQFDLRHLNSSDAAVMVAPAGKSGHLELGYMAKTKPTFILLPGEPERWDVMLQLATRVVFKLEDLIIELNGAFNGV